MPCGHVLRADPVGIFKEFAEFQNVVADNARIGSPPCNILADKIINDPVEFLVKIDCIKGDSQAVGDSAGVGCIRCRAASLPRPRRGGNNRQQTALVGRTEWADRR
jgi:hypothetical protein